MAHEWTCGRCERTFHEFLDDMRDRVGKFVETHDDGSQSVYERLCEDCHRAVVRS